MNDLFNLHMYLLSLGFRSEADYINKISIDIREEELRQAVRSAADERLELNLFDYSSLFPSGQEYVVIGPEDFEKYGVSLSSSEEGLDPELERRYLDLKASYSYLSGVDYSFSEFISEPWMVSVFGERFDLSGNLNKLAVKIYSNIVIPMFSELFRQDFYKISEVVKVVPIEYLNRQDIRNVSDIVNHIYSSSMIFEGISDIDKLYDDFLDIFGSELPIDKDKLRGVIYRISLKIENIIMPLKKIYNYISSIEPGEKKEVVGSSKYSVVISYDAQDIATASYNPDDFKCDVGVDWTSCKNLAQGNYDILKDVVEGGLVAYLVDSENPYPVEQPIARVRIRHFSPKDAYDRNNKDFILKPEKRVYSSSRLSAEESKNIDNILETIIASWVKEANSKIESKERFYSLSGDDHSDTLSDTAVNIKEYEMFGDEKKLDKNRLEDFFGKLNLLPDDKNKNLYAIVSLFDKDFDFKDYLKSLKESSPQSFRSGSLDYYDIVSPENASLFYSKLMETEPGRNLLYKVRQKDLTENDIKLFINKTKNILKLFIDGLYDFSPANEDFDTLVALIIEILEYNDQIGTEINNLYKNIPGKSLKDLVEDFVKNFAIDRFSDINSSVEDFGELKRRIKELGSSYGDEVYGHDFIPKEKQVSIDSKIINLPKDYFNKLGDSFIPILNSKLKKIIDLGIPEITSAVQEEMEIHSERDLGEFTNDLSNSYDDYYAFLKKIEKYVPKGNSDFVFANNISKKYINDYGFIDSKTKDDAIVSLSEKIPGLSEDDIRDRYNIFNLSDIKNFVPSWFFKEGGNFYYKKKVSSGGMLKKDFLERLTGRFNSEEQAATAAKIIGLSENNVIKSGTYWIIR